MKITALLLAIGIAPLAIAKNFRQQKHQLDFSDEHDQNREIAWGHTAPKPAPVEPRGLADDIRTKKKCESMFKTDKTPYVNACAGEADQDSMNLCELRALIGDASVECRAALMKTMGF